MQTRFFCSWSGGKDAALALHRVRQATAGPIDYLLTVMLEDGSRSRSHGMRRELLEAQAERLGIANWFVSSGWDDYEARFVRALRRLARRGVTHGIYGDIDFEENLEWVESVTRSADLVPVEPLWGQSRGDLLDEFLGLGFKAKVVSVNANALPRDLVGQNLEWGLVRELGDLGCDLSGEGGEYHTFTYDGPVFSRPLLIGMGEITQRGDYYVRDLWEDRESSPDPQRTAVD